MSGCIIELSLAVIQLLLLGHKLLVCGCQFLFSVFYLLIGIFKLDARIVQFFPGIIEFCLLFFDLRLITVDYFLTADHGTFFGYRIKFVSAFIYVVIIGL